MLAHTLSWVSNCDCKVGPRGRISGFGDGSGGGGGESGVSGQWLTVSNRECAACSENSSWPASSVRSSGCTLSNVMGTCWMACERCGTRGSERARLMMMWLSSPFIHQAFLDMAQDLLGCDGGEAVSVRVGGAGAVYDGRSRAEREVSKSFGGPACVG